MSDWIKSIFLDILVEATPNLLVAVDGEGAILFINSTAEKLFGYSREELVGKPIEILVPERFRSVHIQDRMAYMSAPSARPMGVGRDLYGRRKDGSEFPLEISLIPKTTDKGTFVLTTLVDITERKRIEQQLKESEEKLRELLAESKKNIQLREEFLSIASHELRTPLTALNMQVQLLHRLLFEEPFSKHPKIAKFVKVLDSSGSQLEQFLKLVNNLLDVTRISAGKIPLNLEEVDLSMIIQNVIERYQSRSTEAGCILEFKAAGPIRVFLDPLRIEQVLVNLLTNAMKYGSGKPIRIDIKESGKAVRLNLQHHGETVRVEVQDHGIGIAKDDHERIFDRFERAASPKSFRGFGLGLFITRQIIEAHGGKIWVESELGKGSIFIVELPKKAQQS